MTRQNDFAGEMGRKYKEAMKILFPGEEKVTAGLASRVIANYNPMGETSVLDLRCGGGEFLKLLANSSRYSSRVHLTGIDSSPAMIEKAERELESEIAKGKARIVQADITRYLEAMELTGQTADVVTANFVFHNFTRAERAIAFPLIYRTIAPGGVLLMLDKVARTNPRLHARDLAEQYRRIDSLAEHGMPELVQPWKKHYDYDETPERIMINKHLRDDLMFAGFKDVRVSYVPLMEGVVEARK